MNLHSLIARIVAHPMETVGYVLAGLAVFALLWGAIKAAIVRVTGRPVPRNGLTLFLDVLAELANNLPGAINRGIGGGLFRPASVGSVAAGVGTIFTPPLGPDEEACLVCNGVGLRSALSITSNPDGTRTEKGYLAHCTYCGGTGRKPKGSQEAPRAAERGSARVGVLVVLALGVLLAALPLGLVVSGCGPAREVVMRAAPGVPEASGCAAGTQRCSGQVPEVCSSSGRWWPSLPVRPDGSQRECVACIVEDGIAGCAR